MIIVTFSLILHMGIPADLEQNTGYVQEPLRRRRQCARMKQSGHLMGGTQTEHYNIRYFRRLPTQSIHFPYTYHQRSSRTERRKI